MSGAPEPETFLSGETGHVAGVRRTLLRTVGDTALDIEARLRTRRLDELASSTPSRNILIISVYRPGGAHIERALAELQHTRHVLRRALGSTGDAASPDTVATHLSGGKFQNLNAVLQATGGAENDDWLLVVDDDVDLPSRFLDRFIALCERFELALAQPAQTLMSHAAWRVTRRRPRSLVRETRFVEIGPVTAFRADAARDLTPFPDLRYGWGLDLHWSAIAAERGWRLGIVDATPIRHERSPVAVAYRHDDAIDEARTFLTGKSFLPAGQAQETLVTHRSLAR